MYETVIIMSVLSHKQVTIVDAPSSVAAANDAASVLLSMPVTRPIRRRAVEPARADSDSDSSEHSVGESLCTDPYGAVVSHSWSTRLSSGAQLDSPHFLLMLLIGEQRKVPDSINKPQACFPGG